MELATADALCLSAPGPKHHMSEAVTQTDERVGFDQRNITPTTPLIAIDQPAA